MQHNKYSVNIKNIQYNNRIRVADIYSKYQIKSFGNVNNKQVNEISLNKFGIRNIIMNYIKYVYVLYKNVWYRILL